ncbi:hypothetical protein RFM68_20820 [Mesorhizobium sp. MSK_1335]|uniref:Uncharacterized protein n=1 Tax=Mesorhizobium montanum TaxID=3072323 RepID=A0ABU4ZNK5_9HYPH|nr:hypothetical protein [Mesorhizobium sp. MSK_1335]MDX8526949.1 hypothetical protein [Mesorhizobium sp. MSK_1335]
MIRYLALAFIFFQVATTTALATQVVLFEDRTADVLSLTGPASAALTPPISPFVRETGAKPDKPSPEHLLIQIYAGKPSQAPSLND